MTSLAGTRLLRELKALGAVALYFGIWLAVLMLIKALLLAEYRIEFTGLSVAIIGALVLSKVVLLLEHVPLGEWVLRRPAWVDVVVRTTLYALGVLMVLLLEKGFEGRHEYGGFFASLRAVFEHADIYHVWLNTICMTGALLVYNVLAVIQKQLGAGELRRLFLTPLPKGTSQ